MTVRASSDRVERAELANVVPFPSTGRASASPKRGALARAVGKLRVLLGPPDNTRRGLPRPAPGGPTHERNDAA